MLHLPPLHVVPLLPDCFRAIGCLKTVLITASVLIEEIPPRDMQERMKKEEIVELMAFFERWQAGIF